MKQLILVKALNYSDELYRNPTTDEEWIKYDFENEESGETYFGIYKLPRLTTDQLVDIIYKSEFLDEVSGAAGLLLYDEWAEGFEFRELLIKKLEELYKNNTPKTFEKIRIVIHRAELIEKQNKRDVLGKTVQEIEMDFKYFQELGNKAESLLRLLDNI